MAGKPLCRMCVEEVEPLLDIFGIFGHEQQIREIVSQHFWFEVKEDDPLSDKICTICWSKLIDFHVFYDLVQKAQDRITMVMIEVKPNEVEYTSEIKDQIVIATQDGSCEEDEVLQNFKIEAEFTDNFADDDSDSEIHPENEKNKLLEGEYIEDEEADTPPTKTKLLLVNDSAEQLQESTELLDDSTEQLNDSVDITDNYGEPIEDDLQLLDATEDLEDSAQEDLQTLIRVRGKRKQIEIKMEKYTDKSMVDLDNYCSTSEEDSATKKKKTGRIKQRGRKPAKREIDEAQKQKEVELIESYFKMQCELCHEDMETFPNLFNHYDNAHQFRGFVVCCGKKFFRRTVIAEHVLWHTQPEHFTCSECNKIYVNKRCLENHMLVHAPPDMKLFQCDHCSKSFVKKFKLEKHKLSHLTDEEKLYICEHCDKPYASVPLLRAHKRVVHQHTYAHMCEICAKVFKSRVFFEKHQLEHLGQNLPKVQCQICEAWMKNEHTMRAHMRNHQDEGQEHECDICGKKGPSRNAIAKHKRFVHLSERKFKCTLCDKAFKRAITLKEHMTVHTGEILYTCTFCPKTFNSGANMHAHRKRAHPCEWFEEKQHKLESMKPSEASP